MRDYRLHFKGYTDSNFSIYLGLLSLNESAQSARLQSPPALSPNSTKSDTPELPPGFEGTLSFFCFLKPLLPNIELKADSRPHHKQQQEQNAHASNVVRRVRARLEGRVEAADHQKVITPSDQVIY